jgi:hypothetical protein
MTDEQMKELSDLRVAIQDLKYQLTRRHDLRELTDEEIDKIIKQHDWYSKTWVDMVRSIESAILKKASEK